MRKTQKGIVMPKMYGTVRMTPHTRAKSKRTKPRRTMSRAYGWIVGKHGIVRQLTKAEQRAQLKFFNSHL